jgi:hypothetical protein
MHVCSVYARRSQEPFHFELEYGTRIKRAGLPARIAVAVYHDGPNQRVEDGLDAVGIDTR